MPAFSVWALLALADSSGAVPGPDQACLSFLAERKVETSGAGATRGVRTPVRVEKLGSVRLTTRGRRPRPAVMDCELARALLEAAPVLQTLGVLELVFSTAYDWRSRRASGDGDHGGGLAIDIQAFRGPRGLEFDVEEDYEAFVGTWPAPGTPPAPEEDCIGNPTTGGGRLLRTLVCRLRESGHFRVVLTPDDGTETRLHVHLEATASPAAKNHREKPGSKDGSRP